MDSTEAIVKKPFTDREAAFLVLYKKAFPLVANYISKMGGSFDEAKDIFQDALIIYYEKTQSSGMVLQYSEKTYLYGIARHLWHKRYKACSRQIPLDQINTDLEENFELADMVYEEISSAKLLHLLQTAGEKCMQLLSAFYYEKLDMNILAERFGFSGPRSATVQKFKCLEKVKETVKEKSLKYENIME